MFVTNIRYGELPVRKVYLGEKLIWQCTQVVGDAYSNIDAKVSFHVQSLDSVRGESNFVSCDNVKVDILSLSMIKGETESYLSSKSSMNLFKLLLAIGESSSKSDAKAVCDSLKTILAQCISDSDSKENVMCRAFVIGEMESVEGSASKSSAIAGVSSQVVVSGSETIGFSDSSAGGAVSIMDVNSFVDSHSSSGAIVVCWIPMKAQAFAESYSYGTSIPNVFDVFLIGGTTSIDNGAEAICKLFDLFSMSGNAKSNFDEESCANLNSAILSNGNIGVSTFCNSIVGEYLLVLGESDVSLDSYCGATPVLWYPHIGDGVPLVKSDGVDITANGNMLEIRQTYQINIDNENGILEVV